MTEEELKQWMSYQPADTRQTALCVAMRTSAWAYAEVVRQALPAGPEQTRALRAIKASLQEAIGGLVAPWPSNKLD